MNIKPLLLALTLLPISAFAAEEHCKFSQPRALDLDLSGAKAVVFEVNSHDLRLQATQGAKPAVSGRACASTQDLLERLTVTQEKVGDKLVVKLARDHQGLNFNFGGSTYSYLDLSGTLPDDILVQLKVGSGDASLTGARSMSADVGSGDVVARDIKELATTAVGSGDAEFYNVGSLYVLSVGSGDVKAREVRGDVRVGTVGSGDVELRGVQGAVSIESIGSGDVDVSDAHGAVTLGEVGSGDLEVRNAASLSVQRVGSGSVNHSGITGAVSLPKKR
ncbi:MAG: DUF4097 family beta strand repeat-containing protein [Stenotrophomonas sp.]|uniref:DUF4097 family beta strand repeat-containing protein n=1 Tax=Stenotrophomonas sp. TaxID=69392 RepID=UPI003D6D4E82